MRKSKIGRRAFLMGVCSRAGAGLFGVAAAYEVRSSSLASAYKSLLETRETVRQVVAESPSVARNGLVACEDQEARLGAAFDRESRASATLVRLIAERAGFALTFPPFPTDAVDVGLTVSATVREGSTLYFLTVAMPGSLRLPFRDGWPDDVAACYWPHILDSGRV